MKPLVVVTGYVKIPGHPRSDAAYQQLGDKLFQIKEAPIHAFQSKLKDCWLDALVCVPAVITHATSDNPRKNTLAYHCVQHQKTTWMLEAARVNSEPDVFVWIDYGIFHQPGISVEVIDTFLTRAANETAIAIPGCWKRSPTIEAIDLANPCWRFCGSTLVCHRRHLETLDAAIRKDVTERLNTTRHVSWEVNTWARVELSNTLPIRWYQGDHDQTQFTGYAP